MVFELLTALGFFINAGGLLSCAVRRPGIPFRRLFVLFAAFIFLGGLGMAVGAFTPRPEPSLVQLLLKALSAAVALSAGAALLPMLPSLMALRAPEELERTYARLADEAQERERAESELRVANAGLENRIRERIREVEEARDRAQAYLRELARQKDELASSNAELEQFAYAASHDLKAPLRAIDNLSQWIAEDLGPTASPEVKEHLALMGQRVKRMSRLLDDLLAYSRVGRQQYAVETVHLDDLVRDVVETLKPGGPGFRFEIHAQLPPFEAAATPLRQVLMNLVSNAMKHHHRLDGLVRIEAVDRGGAVGITVSDDGPGIDPRYNERIFQVFQTLKPRDQVEGSGIGLALVKKILDVHHGSVRVDSQPGHGASFTVVWPKPAGRAHAA